MTQNCNVDLDRRSRSEGWVLLWLLLSAGWVGAGAPRASAHPPGTASYQRLLLLIRSADAVPLSFPHLSRPSGIDD